MRTRHWFKIGTFALVLDKLGENITYVSDFETFIYRQLNDIFNLTLSFIGLILKCVVFSDMDELKIWYKPISRGFIFIDEMFYTFTAQTQGSDSIHFNVLFKFLD